MAKFFRIGHEAFNLDHLTGWSVELPKEAVEDHPPEGGKAKAKAKPHYTHVTFYFHDGSKREADLEEPEATTVLTWLNDNAEDICKVTPAPVAPVVHKAPGSHLA